MKKRNYLKLFFQIALLGIIAVAPTYFAVTHGEGKFAFTTPIIFTLSFLGIVLIGAVFHLLGFDFELIAKNDEPKKYAPLYSKKERIRYFFKHSLWAIPLFLIAKFWFFPNLNEYTQSAHCYNYGSLTGIHIVFYGLFILLPIAIAIVLLILSGKRNLQVIKLAQDPLPNEKVLTQTEYVYGFRAKIKAYAFFIIVFF